MKNVYMLLGAIILEIFGTCLTKFLLMKDLAGTHLVMPIFLLCSYYCLSKAIRTIPISIAYAAWEALGLILTTIVACCFFHEHMPMAKIIAFVLIIGGLVMLEQGTSVAVAKGGEVHGH